MKYNKIISGAAFAAGVVAVPLAPSGAIPDDAVFMVPSDDMIHDDATEDMARMIAKRDGSGSCFDIDSGVPGNIHWNDVDQFVTVDDHNCKPKLALRDGSCHHHMDLSNKCSAFCQTSAFHFYAEPIPLMGGKMCRAGEGCEVKQQQSFHVEISNSEVERHVRDSSASVTPSVNGGFGLDSIPLFGGKGKGGGGGGGGGARRLKRARHLKRFVIPSGNDTMVSDDVAADEDDDVDADIYEDLAVDLDDDVEDEDADVDPLDDVELFIGYKNKETTTISHEGANPDANGTPSSSALRPAPTGSTGGSAPSGSAPPAPQNPQPAPQNPQPPAPPADGSTTAETHKNSVLGRLRDFTLPIPYPTITNPAASISISYGMHWTRDWTRTYHHAVNRASFKSIKHKQVPGEGCGAFWAVPVGVGYCGWSALPRFPPKVHDDVMAWMKTAEDPYDGSVKLGGWNPEHPDRYNKYPAPMWNMTEGRCPVNYSEFPMCYATPLTKSDGYGPSEDALHRVVWRPYDCETGRLLPSAEQPREVRESIDFNDFFRNHLLYDNRLFSPELGWNPASKQEDDRWYPQGLGDYDEEE